jgi:hypothetical protein
MASAQSSELKANQAKISMNRFRREFPVDVRSGKIEMLQCDFFCCGRYALKFVGNYRGCPNSEG